jgi:selenocysteine lyase/cysteine desulfurase
MSDFPIAWVREKFPALNRGDDFIFFDNGAGAQIPRVTLDAVQNHLICRNVQRGGRYRHSVEVDETIQQARQSVAAFLNASSPDEIAFGMNATSFIRIVSLAIAEIMGLRREIIVTDLDHEANIATWLAVEKRGAEIHWWRVRADGCLYLEDLEPLLNRRTRLVACAMASNALGSIVNVKEVSRIAHAAGAEVFVDNFDPEEFRSSERHLDFLDDRPPDSSALARIRPRAIFSTERRSPCDGVHA